MTIFIASEIKSGCLFRQRNNADRSTMIDMTGHITVSILCKTMYHIHTHGQQEAATKLILFVFVFSKHSSSAFLYFSPIFVSFNFFPSCFVCLAVILHFAALFLPLFFFFSCFLSIFVSRDVCSSERTAK